MFCFVWVALHHPCSSINQGLYQETVWGILLGAFLPIFMRNNIANPFLLVFVRTMMCLLLYYYYYNQINSHTKIIPIFLGSYSLSLLMMDCFIYYTQISPGFSCSSFPPLCKKFSEWEHYSLITVSEINRFCLVNIQGLHNVPTDSNQ